MKTANHIVCAFLRRCIVQMKRMGINQTELARRMKISRPYVTKLLSGDVYVSPVSDGRRAADKDFGYVHACATYPVSDAKIKIPIL